MRLRPEPTPRGPRITRDVLQEEVERWLIDLGVYNIPVNRRCAAENLTFSALRAMRGSELGAGASAVLSRESADTAGRRLRRAAQLFVNLADRLED